MERPILFSTDMVQSILDLRKTKTRRTNGLNEINESPNQWKFIGMQNGKALFDELGMLGSHLDIKCPYGKPGDLLWVRETFFDCEPFKNAPLFHSNERYLYKADECFIGCHKWKPSIHMPKAAARIWLKVTNVRVERLQEINFADRFDDAVAEGVSRREDGYWIDYTSDTIKQCTPQGSFVSLWNFINGEQSWSDNPWVWVVEFEVVSTTGRANVKEVNNGK